MRMNSSTKEKKGKPKRNRQKKLTKQKKKRCNDDDKEGFYRMNSIKKNALYISLQSKITIAIAIKENERAIKVSIVWASGTPSTKANIYNSKPTTIFINIVVIKQAVLLHREWKKKTKPLGFKNAVLMSMLLVRFLFSYFVSLSLSLTPILLLILSIAFVLNSFNVILEDFQESTAIKNNTSNVRTELMIVLRELIYSGPAQPQH